MVDLCYFASQTQELQWMRFAHVQELHSTFDPAARDQLSLMLDGHQTSCLEQKQSWGNNCVEI